MLAGRYLESAARAEHMAPGLLRFDNRIGWRLSPGWHGRHVHQDYDVRYTIDTDGYRKSAGAASMDAARIDVYGDSYTFGLGVDDDDTFVARLNRRTERWHLHNRAIPGFSTDQQLLQLEGELRDELPARLWLVIYLGNDLIDIERDYPLQADYAKPRFRLENGRLLAPTSPLAQQRRPAALRTLGLGDVLFEDLPAPHGGWRSRLAATALGRLAGVRPSPRPAIAVEHHLEARLAGNLALFDALLARMARRAAEHDRRLELVLLGGPALVRRPEGDSARFQRFAAARIAAMAARSGLPCIDLSAALVLRDVDSDDLYFDADGHLTPRGHVVVADLLEPFLEDPAVYVGAHVP